MEEIMVKIRSLLLGRWLSYLMISAALIIIQTACSGTEPQASPPNSQVSTVVPATDSKATIAAAQSTVEAGETMAAKNATENAHPTAVATTTDTPMPKKIPPTSTATPAQPTATPTDPPPTCSDGPLNGKIIFLSSRDYSVPNLMQAAPLVPHDLYAMNPDGTDLQRLTSGLRLTNIHAPVLSPEGARIAIGGYARDDTGIRILSPSGEKIASYPLPANVNAVWLHDWSQDGTTILMTVYGKSAPSVEEIYSLVLSSGEYKQLTENSSRNLFATWSPDGSQIAYMNDYELWIMNADGNNKRQLTDGEARDLDWSPDGATIAIESQEVPAGGVDYDLWQVRADGSGKQRLTQLAGITAEQPRWSPDGKTIAFSAHPETGMVRQLNVLDVASGQVTQLTTQDDNLSPQWGPPPCD